MMAIKRSRAAETFCEPGAKRPCGFALEVDVEARHCLRMRIASKPEGVAIESSGTRGSEPCFEGTSRAAAR